MDRDNLKVVLIIAAAVIIGFIFIQVIRFNALT